MPPRVVPRILAPLPLRWLPRALSSPLPSPSSAVPPPLDPYPVPVSFWLGRVFSLLVYDYHFQQHQTHPTVKLQQALSLLELGQGLRTPSFC